MFIAVHGEERTVETARQVGGHDLDVLCSGLDKVDDRNLVNVSDGLFQTSVAHTSGIICRVVLTFKCIVTWRHVSMVSLTIQRCMLTPELLKSFTLSTELMTSLPISSNTRTFHTAPSVDAFVGSLLESSCASTSVIGALRFRMRLMLATTWHISCIHDMQEEVSYLFACPAM